MQFPDTHRSSQTHLHQSTRTLCNIASEIIIHHHSRTSWRELQCSSCCCFGKCHHPGSIYHIVTSSVFPCPLFIFKQGFDLLPTHCLILYQCTGQRMQLLRVRLEQGAGALVRLLQIRARKSWKFQISVNLWAADNSQQGPRSLRHQGITD